MYEESSGSSNFGDLEKIEDVTPPKVPAPAEAAEVVQGSNRASSLNLDELRSNSFDKKTLDNKIKAFE